MSRDDGTPRKNAAKECVDCAALPYRDGPSPWGMGRRYPTQYRPVKLRPIKSGQRRDSYRCDEHTRAAERAAKLRRADNWVLKTKGLTKDQYDALYEAQGRKCWFPRCLATGKVKRLAVDHDRKMAVEVCGHDREIACEECVRGLLCGPHNQLLMGQFAGDLEDAIVYRDDPPWRRLRRAA